MSSSLVSVAALFSLVACGLGRLVVRAVGILAFEINDDGTLSGLVVLLRKIISIDLAQAALLVRVIIV